jgi:hypothetical protein
MHMQLHELMTAHLIDAWVMMWTLSALSVLHVIPHYQFALWALCSPSAELWLSLQQGLHQLICQAVMLICAAVRLVNEVMYCVKELLQAISHRSPHLVASSYQKTHSNTSLLHPSSRSGSTFTASNTLPPQQSFKPWLPADHMYIP